MQTSTLSPVFDKQTLYVLCTFASAHLLDVDLSSLSLVDESKKLASAWDSVAPLVASSIDKGRIKQAFEQTATSGKSNNLRAAGCMLLFWHLFQTKAGVCAALRQTFPAFATWQRAAISSDRATIRSVVYRFGDKTNISFASNVLRLANRTTVDQSS